MASDSEKLIRIVCVGLAGVACLVLAGWTLDMPLLRGLGGSIDMNPSTAAAFLACAAALALYRRRPRGAALLAVLVLLAGLARIAGYALGVEIAIDRLLAGGTSNRMALNTAAAFALAAGGVLLLDFETRCGRRPAEAAAAATAVIGLLALTGHAYQVPVLSQVAAHVIPMAEVTACAFLALSCALLAYRPDRGWVAIVTGPHAGGVMARRLLPLALVMPLLLGFVALCGENLGLYGPSTGYATFAVACVIVLTVVVLATARSLGHADLALRAAHRAEQCLRAQLERVDAASLAISEAFATDDVLQQIVDRARTITSARFAAIGIGTDPRQPFSQFAQSGMSPHPSFRGMSPNHPEIASFLAAPVRYRGHTIGNIYLGNKLEAGAFTAEDERALLLLSSHVGVALENARLYREAVLDRVRLATVLEQLPEGVVVRDETGKVIVYNETARALARQPDGWPEIHHKNGTVMTADEHPVRRALQRGESVMGLEAELSSDGRRVPVLVNAAPIRHPDGAPAGAVAVFQDITPLRQVERMREEWNAVIAHDLRQPVNVIQLGATLLERRAALPRDRQMAARIVSAARNLDVMIGDLLDLSRLEADRLDLRKRPSDVTGLARDLIERTMALDPDRPIRLKANGASTEVPVDPARIEQVLGNLLSNAAKYGAPGTEIEVAVEGNGANVHVSVTNRGPGIPADELPRLFSRFYRARAAHEGGVRGIGLGLYLCKGLVEAHGGSIHAESRPGDQTTFRFTLPRSA